MSDPCFCHFNGFAVKDATARKQIEENAEWTEEAIREEAAARAAAIQEEAAARQQAVLTESEERQRDMQGLAFVDVSDNVELAFNAEASYTAAGNVTKIEKHYKYSPGLGILQYDITVYLSGTFATDEHINILQTTGPQKPLVGTTDTILPCYAFDDDSQQKGVVAMYTRGAIVLETSETVNGFCPVKLSGWHFVEPWEVPA